MPTWFKLQKMMLVIILFVNYIKYVWNSKSKIQGTHSSGVVGLENLLRTRWVTPLHLTVRQILKAFVSWCNDVIMHHHLAMAVHHLTILYILLAQDRWEIVNSVTLSFTNDDNLELNDWKSWRCPTWWFRVKKHLQINYLKNFNLKTASWLKPFTADYCLRAGFSRMKSIQGAM